MESPDSSRSRQRNCAPYRDAGYFWRALHARMVQGAFHMTKKQDDSAPGKAPREFWIEDVGSTGCSGRFEATCYDEDPQDSCVLHVIEFSAFEQMRTDFERMLMERDDLAQERDKLTKELAEARALLKNLRLYLGEPKWNYLVKG